MLRKYIDIFVLCYLDNIVIFLQVKKKHTRHVCLVLQKLRKYNLYIKLFKYIFDVEKINFFGFQVSQYRIAINLSKLDTILIWPIATRHRKVQMFFRFANFYCHFIQSFSKVFLGLSNLLKRATNRSFKVIKFVMTNKALKLFTELKQFFACIPILIYYDFACQIILECNVSRFAIGAILLQLVGKTS